MFVIFLSLRKVWLGNSLKNTVIGSQFHGLEGQCPKFWVKGAKGVSVGDCGLSSRLWQKECLEDHVLKGR